MARLRGQVEIAEAPPTLLESSEFYERKMDATVKAMRDAGAPEEGRGKRSINGEQAA